MKEQNNALGLDKESEDIVKRLDAAEIGYKFACLGISAIVLGLFFYEHWWIRGIIAAIGTLAFTLYLGFLISAHVEATATIISKAVEAITSRRI